jgi:hypothetical protein
MIPQRQRQPRRFAHQGKLLDSGHQPGTPKAALASNRISEAIFNIVVSNWGCRIRAPTFSSSFLFSIRSSLPCRWGSAMRPFYSEWHKIRFSYREK